MPHAPTPTVILFETLFGVADAVVGDDPNHASVFDGIHLRKAGRFWYKHHDPADLKRGMGEAALGGARFNIVIAADAFSMDGTIARVDRIRERCDKYDAPLEVDECAATGGPWAPRAVAPMSGVGVSAG